MDCTAKHVEHLIENFESDNPSNDCIADIREDCIEILREYLAHTDLAKKFYGEYPADSKVCAAINANRLEEYYFTFTETLCSTAMDKRYGYMHKPSSWTEMFERLWEDWQRR